MYIISWAFGLPQKWPLIMHKDVSTKELASEDVTLDIWLFSFGAVAKLSFFELLERPTEK